MGERLEVTVKGRVQGVGFRNFVQRQATSLGLKGHAKNLPNGNVEVIAEGSSENLEKLVAALRKGPALSRVDEVKAIWSKAGGSFKDFSYG